MKTLVKLSTICFLVIFLLFSCKKADSTSSADVKIESASRDEAAATTDASDSETAGSKEQLQIQAGQITAGEWNDLNNWSFWESISENSEFSEKYE